MSKIHSLVKKIILGQKIFTQQEIITVLKEQFNIHINQPGLSKICQKLGISKSKEGYYVLKSIANQAEILNMMVTSIVCNESVVIVKVYSSAAPLIAKVIDKSNLSGVLATIPGDDVVLVVPISVTKVELCRQQIAELFVHIIENN